jgi:hypothetical protein
MTTARFIPFIATSKYIITALLNRRYSQAKGNSGIDHQRQSATDITT